MSFYRDSYLKSEHWQNIRVARIAKQKGRCRICSSECGLALDVHHVSYRKLYDVNVEDLRGLCRRCHDWVHEILKARPDLKGNKETGKRWKKIVKAVRKMRKKKGIILPMRTSTPEEKKERKRLKHERYVKICRSWHRIEPTAEI